MIFQIIHVNSIKMHIQCTIFANAYTVHYICLQRKTHSVAHGYNRTPEIETANLSQFHDGLNLSQFQAVCLFRINSSTAILKNKTIYISTRRYLRSSQMLCHAFNIFCNNYECLTLQFKIILINFEN